MTKYQHSLQSNIYEGKAIILQASQQIRELKNLIASKLWEIKTYKTLLRKSYNKKKSL